MFVFLASGYCDTAHAYTSEIYLSREAFRLPTVIIGSVSYSRIFSTMREVKVKGVSGSCSLDSGGESHILQSESFTPEIEKKYVHYVYDAIAPHFRSTRWIIKAILNSGIVEVKVVEVPHYNGYDLCVANMSPNHQNLVYVVLNDEFLLIEFGWVRKPFTLKVKRPNLEANEYEKKPHESIGPSLPGGRRIPQSLVAGMKDAIVIRYLSFTHSISSLPTISDLTFLLNKMDNLDSGIC
ncbi:unnamed protein product [Malus baccata var. baccata]